LAKFECVCGKLLSNSLCPNDIEYHVYSDKEWDQILAEDKIDTSHFPFPQYDVWRCPDCERIYIFDENHMILSYAIETDNRK
jgi:hypothetical protein